MMMDYLWQTKLMAYKFPLNLLKRLCHPLADTGYLLGLKKTRTLNNDWKKTRFNNFVILGDSCDKMIDHFR